eukprot:scaffold88678_cov79-Cyclotella_meneghiniana.AAC.2
MLGSATIGLFYEYAVRTFKVEGRGPRYSLLLCALFGIVGSALYASAGWIENADVARQCILVGSIPISGCSTICEVEYTATLSTCAVLGFVMGPSIGAIFCQIDATMYGLSINANNAPGFLILVATCTMFVQTLLFFDGKDDQSCVTSKDNEVTNNRGSSTDSNQPSINSNHKELPFNTVGVLMSIFIFLVHYYSFAVQETITTPLVITLYNWSPIQINLLFAGAGMISLITSFSVRYISRHVQDQTLLIASIVIGLLGSLLQMDIPQIERVLPINRFILGFILATMAFPIGRNVVLGLFSNILGPVSQGRWMGVIIAVSAVPRALGPFLALEALEAVHWRTWLEFGLCSLFFFLALVGTVKTTDILVPYSEFVGGMSCYESVDSHVHMPSPVLARQNSLRKSRLKNAENVA